MTAMYSKVPVLTSLRLRTVEKEKMNPFLFFPFYDHSNEIWLCSLNGKLFYPLQNLSAQYDTPKTPRKQEHIYDFLE